MSIYKTQKNTLYSDNTEKEKEKELGEREILLPSTGTGEHVGHPIATHSVSRDGEGRSTRWVRSREGSCYGEKEGRPEGGFPYHLKTISQDWNIPSSSYWGRVYVRGDPRS